MPDARSLRALDRAFGRGTHVSLHTAQRNTVVDRLLAGLPHVQPWSASAAYDTTKGRGWRMCHKRAYCWMTREFERRMGTALSNAPIWLSFDYDDVLKCQKAWGRDDNEKVLSLTMPRSELLLSMYAPWADRVLYGWCCDEQMPLHPPMHCGHTGAQRREKWARIFDLADNPREWQGVAARIDPDWVTAVDGAPANAKHEIALSDGMSPSRFATMNDV